MQFSGTSSRTVVMALSYIDQLINDDECPITITRFNVHRLLVVAILVACKFYEDRYYDNQWWANVAGFSLEEINKLERKFLAYINFDINTKPERYINYVQLLLSYGVENSVLDPDDAKAILQSIIDATVQELGEAENQEEGEGNKEQQE